MENKITDKIETLINKKFSDDTKINTFIKANEEYQKLIKEGLTTKRGFNIMTIEEIYRPILHCQHTQSIE